MNNKLKQWLKRVGWIGVLFFTVKGIIWLIIFYFGVETLEKCTQ